jgi:hypothetical protein
MRMAAERETPEVHLGPGEREQLVLDPPAGEVGHIHERVQRGGQMVPHGQVLRVLEEPLPGVLQLQQGDARGLEFPALLDRREKCFTQ